MIVSSKILRTFISLCYFFLPKDQIMKNLSLFIMFFILPLVWKEAGSRATAQNKKDLTLEDIWKKSTFREKFIGGIRPMKDGIHYSSLHEGSESGLENILVHDFKTGAVSDTFFKGSWFIPKDSTHAIAFDDYTLSEDETKILFSAETEQIYRHSTIEYYFVWDRKNKTLSPLSKNGKQRLAVFSPDGQKVAFVRDNNLFIGYLNMAVDSNGKEYSELIEVQITFDGKRNSIINGATDWVYEEEFSFTQAFFWSPDGNRIAFYRFDESPIKEFSFPEYTDLYATPYQFKYPKAGEKNSTVSIHVYDLKSKNISTMDIGNDTDQYIPRIKWTHDANILCIQRMNRHQNKLELLLADAKTGVSKILFAEESKTYIDINDNLTFLKDGKHFIWTSEKDGFNHIYLYNLEAHMHEEFYHQITKGNWDVTSFYGVDEKNKLVYFQSAEIFPLERHIFSIGLDGKNKKQLTSKKGTHRADFTPTFSFYVNYYSASDKPTETEIYSGNGKLIRVLENNKKLSDTLSAYKISKKEFFSFKNSEGVELNGYMIKPYNFDPNKKYPVFMYVYGGPGSQTVTDSWDGRNFLWFQYIANQGYLVVSVDNRGTGARGDAFKKITYLQLGKYEVDDQIDAAKYLGTLNIVDKDRIGIWGWSYGGYMTALCMTVGADVFKMGISVAPVTHWKFYDSIYTERYMRTPQENPDGYKDGSPLTYADKLKGKYLLIHGTADDNVHFQNSAEFVLALQNANKQFDLMIYPNKNHGISGGVTRMNLYTKMTNYILENL